VKSNAHYEEHFIQESKINNFILNKQFRFLNQERCEREEQIRQKEKKFKDIPQSTLEKWQSNTA
jgi:hypothetical protein